MFPDGEANCVYISALLPERCPTEYGGLIQILNRHGIPVVVAIPTQDPSSFRSLRALDRNPIKLPILG